MDPKKLCALTEYLLRQNRPVTSGELAKFLNLSKRTIKSYVASINEEQGVPMIHSSHRGYEIDREEASKYVHRMRSNTAKAPQNYQERAQFINLKFLKYHTGKIDLYDLADEMCYSPETVRSDVMKMNRTYEGLGISYEIRSDTVCLHADEKSLRKLAYLVYFSDMPELMLDDAAIEQVYSDIDVSSIRSVIRRVMRRYDFYINDFGMVNLVLHIVIILNRLMKGRGLTALPSYEADKNSNEYMAVTELCEDLSQHFGVEFNDAEMLNLYMLVRANANLESNMARDDYRKFVGEDLIAFTRGLTGEIDTKYYVDLNKESFLIPFSMHVRNLIFRIQNNQSVVNPMGEMIRYSHPIIFDMAVFSASRIKEKYGIPVPEAEIAYLALHIGGEMERQKQTGDKIRTVLLCPEYLSFSSRIYNELLIDFGSDIDMVGRISAWSELAHYRCDMLITTIAPREKVTDPYVVLIPPFEGRKRDQIITDAIEEVRLRKTNLIVKDHLNDIFSAQFFIVNKDTGLDRECIIHTLADVMLRAGVVQENFCEKMLEREMAASTGFPNIAIPHSMQMDAVRTSVGVMLCPDGVNWDGQIVRIVLAIAINKGDIRLFPVIYQTLIRLFDDEQNLLKILRADTFETFIQYIREMLAGS